MRFQKVSHLFSILQSSIIQPLISDELSSKDIQVDIKRDDLIHPIISGNKWRKLKYLLLDIEAKGYKKIAAMGGHYSNLLHTLSYVSQLLGWQCQLYIRGHKAQALTPMLQDAKRWGVQIEYVERKTFRELRNSPPLLNDDIFWISEGGFSELAIKGSIESLMELPEEYDYLVVACATGTSLAGYCQGVANNKFFSKPKKTMQVVGIPVLKNNNEIYQNVELLIDGKANDRLKTKVKPQLISGYEFGGYAKSTSELNDFMILFEKQHNIPLEPVYSGKSFYALMDLVKRDYFPKGSRILLIHCGGLQGKRS